MKALLYTSDPHEPSGVIGLFETEEQKQNIIAAYSQSVVKFWKDSMDTIKFPNWYAGKFYQTREEAFDVTINQRVADEIKFLKEIEIPIGVYGEYY